MHTICTRYVLRPAAAVGMLLALATVNGRSAERTTRPVEGLREHDVSVHALTGARIVMAPDRILDHGTLVLRDGIIAEVGQDAQPPADARVWDLSGKTIYPGLIDGYSEQSIEEDSAASATQYWNGHIRPELRMATRYRVDRDQNKQWRSQGFTARLVAPSDGIVCGTSALVSTADGEPHNTVLANDVALHICLTTSRRRRGEYPSSPMGAVALARQAFYDALWYRDAWNVFRSQVKAPRPEQNRSLEALQDYVGTSRLVIAETMDEQYLLRADRFAREFALNLIVLGSGHEYRRLAAVQAAGRPIIVPLAFPKPPHVGTSETARHVTLEQLMHWDHAPENAARLAASGLPVLLTTHGLKDTSEFLAALRKAVRRGLAREQALYALTVAPAELFGQSARLGTLERGKLAHFVITDGDLFDEGARILETWVDGHRYVVADVPRHDLTGTWQLTPDAEGPPPLRLRLAGKPTELKGHILRSPADDTRADDTDENARPSDPPTSAQVGQVSNPSYPASEQAQVAPPSESDTSAHATTTDDVPLAHLQLNQDLLTGTFDAAKFDTPGVARLSAVILEHTPDAAQVMIVTIAWPDGRSGRYHASRSSEAHSPPEPAAPESDKPQPESDKASFPVNYPLGSYGRSGSPEQPAVLAIRNVTIWTCAPPGILESATLLVRSGKIAAVGTDVQIPDGAQIVDGQGRHLTPGIIDCHSHMATDGGVNEGTQAITAEVRIGDFIDANDMAIYEQLAGGVTTANVLHGSANPIGGQNQVIKLRWGATDEDLKFHRAPPGIKFALGENVKQSNWGDGFTTRYPQTRMGVEQIIRDAFLAARQYQQQHDEWRHTHRGLPPRKDLELEALVEVLDGDRWIHCHSYRQDEILALLRVLEEFGVQIGTLQHILEGYKVAEALKQHGAMASSFSDWWAYKFEVYDAIPFNGALMHQMGIVVSFNSDDRELARHLNQEAAKAVKYGSVPPDEALKFVTLNPARQLRIDGYVGSIEPGKDADFVLWSGPPLSNFSRCEQTWIDGRKYFDINEAREAHTQHHAAREKLIQKILASGQPMQKEGEDKPPHREMWPREDLFCPRHDAGR